ncbi:FAD-dependent oxidoreductase [Limnohabitans sp. T6-5]|uniref:NAD(P)/FAD-dependent oxidoreductase n=1 Tax=Limnohabitans sp. T6-5 TaxID=1100724 RepID=UPI000D335D1C|nr:FAD-dependent oxidoreductase [Limnohabitans sp. T6-5]PUE09247.1 FAD-dependent oxidoreductase [Limnohabitans sp. T6-5]
MTHNTAPVVIVGSGLAAWTVARELRKLDKRAPITLISRDSGDFYSKPMLSNALASGKTAAQLVNSTADKIAQQLGVTVQAHTDVTGVDRASKTVQTSQGTVSYAKLVLATGAAPIRVALAGNAANQVLSVNDLADYDRFRQKIAGRQRITIMGAGLIGCEFANDLALGGYEIDVVDPGLQAMGRLLPDTVAQHLQSALQQAGIRFHWGTSVQAVDARHGSLQVQLANGQTLATDAVLSAIGLRPRIALASACGLTTNRGIVVNSQLETSDPDIFALGDGAEIDGQVRSFVMPIMQAARVIATQLAGTPAALTWPVMPVVVKTPAMPVVVVPPPAQAKGEWSSTHSEDGVSARFASAEGKLLGFALAGSSTALKNQLVSALSADLV